MIDVVPCAPPRLPYRGPFAPWVAGCCLTLLGLGLGATQGMSQEVDSPPQAGIHVAAEPRASAPWILIVSGIAGDSQQEARFQKTASSLRDVARERWRIPESQIVQVPAVPVPTESPPRGARPWGASRMELDEQFRKLAGQLNATDTLWVFVLAHGNYDGRAAYFHLAGPDPSASVWADWLNTLPPRQQVVVLMGSASGWFLKPLSRADRVTITATAADDEFNATEFPEALVTAAGLPVEQLDQNHDGRVSWLELFLATAQTVEERFAADRRLPTEHAQLDDDGNGQGTERAALREAMAPVEEARASAGDSPAASSSDAAPIAGDSPPVATAPRERRDGGLAARIFLPRFEVDTQPSTTDSAPDSPP